MFGSVCNFLRDNLIYCNQNIIPVQKIVKPNSFLSDCYTAFYKVLLTMADSNNKILTNLNNFFHYVVSFY